MADKAAMNAYLDDATTNIGFKPWASVNTEKVRKESWRQGSNTLPLALQATLEMSTQTLKDGTERRLLKVSRPAAEVAASGGDAFGYVSDPSVNYSLDPYIVVPVPKMATDTDVANALKLLVNLVTGDVTAGTANAYRDDTAPGREFLVHGFMPD